MGKKIKPHTKDTKSAKRRKKRKQHGFVDPSVLNKSWDLKKTLRQNFVNMGLAMDANSAVTNEKTIIIGVLPDEVQRVSSITGIEAYRVKSMSIKEQRRLRSLQAKYGDDYKAMARDMKINVNQETAGQLRRRTSILAAISSL